MIVHVFHNKSTLYENVATLIFERAIWCNRASSPFVMIVYGFFSILENLSRGKTSWMWKFFSYLSLDIVVNLSPCISILPMSIVVLCSIIPRDLWMGKAHAIVTGILFRVPKVNKIIGTNFGSFLSNGGPL